MRVAEPEGTDSGGRRRVEAVLRWEDGDRPSRRLWFEAPAGTEGFRPGTDAFLMAAFPLALATGERRVRVEGAACSRLRDELRAVMIPFERWFGLPPLRLEARDGFSPAVPRRSPRTGAFLSGGVDSLALLWSNARQYPARHPGRIRDCLFLFGTNTYDFDGTGQPRPERIRMFREQRERLERLASEVGCDLVTMATNARALHPDFTAWSRVGFAPACVGAALTCAARFDGVWLASNGDRLQGGVPGSVHPLVVTHLATAALQAHLGQVAAGRLEKLQLILDWREAMASLRVCLLHDELPRGKINCGRCEKCLRTMIGLLVLGRLAEVPAFDEVDLTPDRLATLRMEPWMRPYYGHLVPELRRLGRDDLARVLAARLAAAERNRDG